jgi:hypothetical protein
MGSFGFTNKLIFYALTATAPCTETSYGYVCAQGQMICQNKLHKEPFRRFHQNMWGSSHQHELHLLPYYI